MSKLFYMLEDHFDAVAEKRLGHVSGVLSRAARSFCAFFGDLVRAAAPRSQRH